MPQNITCPHCSQRLLLPDEAAGRSLACPRCKKAFTAPVAAAPRPAAPPRAAAAAPKAAGGRCPNCQAPLPAGARGCLDCGALVGAAAAAPPAVRQAPPAPVRTAPAVWQAPPAPVAPARTAAAVWQAPPVAARPPAVAAAPPSAAPARGDKSAALWMRLAPAGLLLLLIGGILGRDMLLSAPPPPAPPVVIVPVDPPYVEPLIDPDPLLALQFDEDSAHVDGLGQFVLKMTRELDKAGKPKLLTYFNDDKPYYTNYASVKIDDKPYVLGKTGLGDARDAKSNASGTQAGNNGFTPGTWQEYPILKTAPDPSGRTGPSSRGVFLYDRYKIEATQVVEVVPGQAIVGDKRLLDTCLMRFRIENKDDKPHKVGFRFLLDTYIGSNDGAPFYIPSENAFCTTSREFRDDGDKKVPNYLQAMESDKLDKPGTVAHLTLKTGRGLEAPDRVLLTHWADVLFNDHNSDNEFRMIDWNGKLVDIGGDPNGAEEADRRADSSVVMFWQDKELKPGEHRDVGFAYGLGYVASSEGGTFGLTAGDPSGVGSTFDVTAFTTDPTPGQEVTLTLPPGLEVVGGAAAKQKVPPAGAGGGKLSVVWTVKVVKPGTYKLIVHSNFGPTASTQVNIAPPAPKGKEIPIFN